MVCKISRKRLIICSMTFWYFVADKVLKTLLLLRFAEKSMAQARGK